ncbi:MAG: hypothetical protein AAF583_04485 [Pseudomonadota bacterium]
MKKMHGQVARHSQQMLSDEKERENTIIQLRRILASSEFSAAPRMSSLLEYLVNETLAGRSHALKGYTIGVDVFGKPSNFDP